VPLYEADLRTALAFSGRVLASLQHSTRTKTKAKNLLVEGGVELVLWFWATTGNRATNAGKTSDDGLLVYSGRQRSLVNVLVRWGILFCLTQMSGKHFL
jgi:hypothetical protein